MIGTFVGLLLTCLLLIVNQTAYIGVNPTASLLLMTVVGSSFILSLALLYSATCRLVQKAELKLTPQATQLLIEDRSVTIASVATVILLLVGLAIVSLEPSQGLWATLTFGSILLVLGIMADFLLYIARRMAHLLDPYETVSRLQKKIEGYADKGSASLFCDGIDALAETAFQSIHRRGASLASHAVEAMEDALDHYCIVARKVQQAKTASQESLVDEVRYVLYYTLERLEMVYDEALMKRLSSVNLTLVGTLGKAALATSKVQLDLSSYPLHHLGRLGANAVEKGFSSVGVKTTLTFQECARALLEQEISSSQELKMPLMAIIHGLEMTAKNAFRLDKSIKIPLLAQPFITLKTLLESEKLKDPDLNAVRRENDRVLSELSALAQVMVHLPPPGVLSQEPESNQETTSPTANEPAQEP